MPGVLSKVLMSDWSVPYNCYEVGHTWTPWCSEAALDIGLIVLRESLKLYAPLYLATQALQRKGDLKTFRQTLNSILRSSLFLSFNGFSVILLFCLTRHLTGKFYYSICAYIPAFIGSLMAITIERPSRRPALAVYVANVASETLFRIFTSRGYFKPIKNGEVILFTISMSLLLYIIKKNGFGGDPVSLGLKLIVGREEAKVKTSRINTNQCENLIFVPKEERDRNFLSKALERISSFVPKHRSCPHKHNSCLTYVLLAFVRSFSFGWLAKSAIKTLSKPKLLILRPKIIKDNLLDKNNLKFGLFLAAFTTIYKGINCSLRWASDRSHDWHALIAGLFAGPTMLISPNTSITLYLLWKCIESLYCIGAKNGYIPFVNQTIHLLYAISTAQLFYAAVLEPKHMKPSYMRFLDRMTAHRLHLLNRMVLDVFGTDSSAGYQSYLPDFDLSFTTKRFQESILLRLL